MQQIRTLWEGLEPRQRLIGALSLLAVVAAVLFIGRVATQPSMALLYSGLDPAAAGEIVAELEASGVPFEVRDNAILVESAARDRVRMALAGKGLPAGGPAGYEILDGLSGFGTTSQMFDAAYWRAKEGELARTITGSRNVRSARVHLARPVNQPFARAPKGSASVTVTMAQGELSPSQAQAIRYLVSSAVAGVAPEAVAVIDAARGVVLAGAEDGPLNPALPKPADRAEALRANLERLLEARVGPGRAIVEVNVDAEMNSETISERVIDPESRVAISSETEESSETSQGGSAGVTVASNLPDGDAGEGASQSQRQASESRERQNFEVSETRRERVVLPGQVRRISVAVMVDGILETGADGAETWSPRPPEEIETLRQLVQSAIGFDEARGDVVTIETLRFTLPAEAGVLVEGGSGFLAENGARLTQLGILAAIVLALIFFVLRPMLAQGPRPLLAELTGPRDIEPPRQLAGNGLGGDILDLPPQSASKIDRLREVIASRGEDFGRSAQGLDRGPRPSQGARPVMTVLRLETFAPGAALRPADRRREIEAAREMAFRAGYLEGQSAATEAHLSEEGRLTAELVEAVSDARMTNEAARRHVAASLAPAIEALCAALAPSLAAAGLAAEIARLVERALAASPEARPRLRCAPEVAQRLRALFAERFPGAEIEEARRAASARGADPSGTRDTTTSISTPAWRRFSPASPRTCNPAIKARTMTSDGMNDAPEPAAPATGPTLEPEPAEARAAARAVRGGAFLGVPIEVTISVGKARPLVSELVELRRDLVLTLDSSINDPVELYIGDRLIARGELQEIGDDSGRLAVRLTEVADFSHEL